MKKRIFMMLVAMVMMLGMVQTVFAEEVKVFNATGEIIFDHIGNDYYSISDARLEYSSQRLAFTFFIDGVEHSLILTVTGNTGSGTLDECEVEYDGVYQGIQYSYYYAFMFNDDYSKVNIKLGAGEFFMGGDLALGEVSSTEPEILQISTAL